MPSLQLLQLTERGRSLMGSRRKTLAVATALLVGAGATAYMQSRLCSSMKPDAYDHHSSSAPDVGKPSQVAAKDRIVRKKRQKIAGLKSLQVLAAILLSQMGQKGMQNLLGLVIIVVLRTSLSNRLAKVQGFLFRAAFLRRVPSFLRLIAENLLLCFLQSALFSTSKYLTGTLSLRFRKILTSLIHADYFENMAYYKMSHVDGRITNPEQRIASDIPRFCSELSDLVQEDMTAVADGLLYTWRLCSYASPKYFFWILAYVTGAGLMIGNFSPSFGKLMAEEQQLEGEYRQLHSRLRTHAESIAFYGGENREESHIQQRFKTLVGHMNLVLHDHWWFGMIQDFLLKYLGATVGVILIIEPFFSGNLRPDTSTLGRAEMLSNLRYHTSVIISLFQSLGTLSISSRRLNRLSGYANRIHELMIISRELSVVNDGQNNASRNYFSEASYIEFSGVKVVTPTNNVLVKDLSLRVESGSNLLITGPNGSGKSSLFRVLGGLWPLVSGYIVKPGIGSDLNKEIFYVPQRPYTAVGTLRDQLIYPLTAEEETEPLTYDEMVDLLKNVDLEYLLDRYPLDEEINWGDELSLGEQQRLGMARLFYHKPKFAILDECTSAVTTDMEERFCAKVRAMGTSCITISHRPALVAFHDMVLSLDGEGGWSVNYKREDSSISAEEGNNLLFSAETDRRSDAIAVQRAFVPTKKGTTFSNSRATDSYIKEVLAKSPAVDRLVSLPVVPQLRKGPGKLTDRVAAMVRVLVPTLLDRQGLHLFAVALLVVSRTWISDRIASLNGTSVKYVLEQDKAAFIRLTGVSVLQSAASSIVAPSLRYLTARLALGWRIRLTQYLLKNYLRKNAFYKVFHMSGKTVDADQRITHDVEKLTTDLSGLVTGMVKPSMDILWFTWRMKLLTGQRGVAILYTYMLLGLGFLRSVTPEFGDLTSREQQLEGTFRFMHSRLRTHAESVAFFGGGARERAMVDSRFRELLAHSVILLKKKWLFGILDDFITKQLPHNVTWVLSLLYALEHKGDRALTSTQGELAHALRFLASVVSQSFLAFGDILELHRKYLELSGGVNRIFELEELLDAAQVGFFLNPRFQYEEGFVYSDNIRSGVTKVIERLAPNVTFAIEATREIAQFRGKIGRFGDLTAQTAVGIMNPEPSLPDPPVLSSERSDVSADLISFSDVDIITPTQKLLAKQLKCDIVQGKSVLVTGPNGSGKSSIFRVLRGLWPVVSGKLIKPEQNINEGMGLGCGVFYVPQRPYTSLGTLRDQIIYPLSRKEAELRVSKISGQEGFFLNPRFQYQEDILYSDNIRSGVTKVIERLAPDVTFAIEATREVAQFRGKIGRFGDLTAQTAVGIMNPGVKSISTQILDDQLRSTLENVRLVYLLEREEEGLDARLNWEDVLSLGEQQRLGMARLFFHHPKFGILDECTNATSVDVEEHLYKLAHDMGITVVTTSQRPALIPFHSLELRLIDGEGNWELRSIRNFDGCD